MTTAQQQIKDMLGDKFHLIAEFSSFRKIQRGMGVSDEEMISHITAEPGSLSPEEIRIMHSATDVYDRYF
jgi:hypothetical protein